MNRIITQQATLKITKVQSQQSRNTTIMSSPCLPVYPENCHKTRKQLKGKKIFKQFQWRVQMFTMEKWEKESSTAKENLQMRATNALREISLRKNAIVYKMITINAGICNVYSMNIFF